MKTRIVTHGVGDIARLKGLPYLTPGDRIFPEDMEAWESRTGVRVGRGLGAALGPYGRRANRSEEAPPGSIFDPSVAETARRCVDRLKPPAIRHSPLTICSKRRFNFVRRISVSMCSTRADLEALSGQRSLNRWEFMLNVNPGAPQPWDRRSIRLRCYRRAAQDV
jgi:hypothetical protein